MAWFRVDDKLHDHPKIRKLRADKMACLGLWTACGSWSADTLSDGFVPAEIVHRFDPDEGLAKRLVEVGLWIQFEHDGEDGYLFHQWTDHQPTKAEVERRRDEARERMRKRRAGGSPEDSSKSADGSQNVRANTERTSSEVRHPDPTRPVVPKGTTPAAAAADRFAEFYDVYPRKRERRKAEQAWKAAIKRGADPDRVIRAVRRFAQQCQGKDITYVKYPASWLNAGGYDDEPEQPTLSLVQAAPTSFEDYRTRGDAQAVARLVGAVWIEPAQPPSDETPAREWRHARAVEFIDAHEAELRAALTERKTG